jgi:hypothetical protein
MVIVSVSAAGGRTCSALRRRAGFRAADINAARVSPKPTGNAGLDDYCRHVAAVIDGFFATGDRDRALGALEQGRQLGCRLARRRSRRRPTALVVALVAI